MSLTRKRKKELKRLRSSAQDLWSQQQDILDQANAVAHEASRQANYLTKEHVVPRVRSGYQTVRSGYGTLTAPAVYARNKIAGSARDRLVGDVLPAVGSAIGTALTVVDHARDTRARTFLEQRNPNSKSKNVAKSDSGTGPGTYVAIVLGIIAAAGVLYAVWQTFRADDELWVADEETPTTETTD